MTWSSSAMPQASRTEASASQQLTKLPAGDPASAKVHTCAKGCSNGAPSAESVPRSHFHEREHRCLLSAALHEEQHCWWAARYCVGDVEGERRVCAQRSQRRSCQMIKRLPARRPSPAMIIAVIALIAALGGTAVAGGVLTTKKFKKQAVRGPVQYVAVTTSVPSTNVPDSPGVHVAATCPAGTHVIGGGVKLSLEADMFVNDSTPTTSGWAGTVFNGNAAAQPATTTAICATVQKVSGSPPSS